MSFCVIMSTASGMDEAKKLARLLLESRAAACVTAIPAPLGVEGGSVCHSDSSSQHLSMAGKGPRGRRGSDNCQDYGGKSLPCRRSARQESLVRSSRDTCTLCGLGQPKLPRVGPGGGFRRRGGIGANIIQASGCLGPEGDR